MTAAGMHRWNSPPSSASSSASALAHADRRSCPRLATCPSSPMRVRCQGQPRHHAGWAIDGLALNERAPGQGLIVHEQSMARGAAAWDAAGNAGIPFGVILLRSHETRNKQTLESQPRAPTASLLGRLVAEQHGRRRQRRPPANVRSLARHMRAVRPGRITSANRSLPPSVPSGSALPAASAIGVVWRSDGHRSKVERHGQSLCQCECICQQFSA